MGEGSINYNGADDDYWNAWGYEGEEWNYEPNYDYNNDYGGYFLGNVMMMLEVDTGDMNGDTTNTDAIEQKDIDMSRYTMKSKHALKGTTTARLVTLHNYTTYGLGGRGGLFNSSKASNSATPVQGRSLFWFIGQPPTRNKSA